METMSTTTDHSTIRDWVLKYNGLPVKLKTPDNTTLAVSFEETRNSDQYLFITWEEWFNAFEDQKLAFRYHNDQPAYKLVKRDDQTDLHLQSPGEANRDKHINFVELEQNGR